MKLNPGLAAAAPAALAVVLAAAPQESTLVLPPRDVGVDTLEERGRAQRAASAELSAFHDFRFTDRQPESGIAFRHQIVDDAGYHYKPVHYDHGNGVSVADVDGDGRLDVYFTTQLGANELWRNVGGGRFEMAPGSQDVALADRISVAAGFGDVDADGDADLFVTTVRMGNALFLNDGAGRFTDVSQQAGVDYAGHSSSVTFLDFDADGRLDMLVTNVGRYTTDERGRGGYYVGLEDAFKGHNFPERAERSLLYRNLGGSPPRFEEVGREVGFVDDSWSGDASIVDFDGDRDPDVYVLNMQGDDHYYENHDGRFVERTAAHFPKTPWGAMGVKFFDYDLDGHVDLLVTDMHSDMAEDIGPEREKLKSVVEDPERDFPGVANNLLGNAFYRGLGEGRFEEVSDAVGAENYWPWGVSVGDVNADGYDDVFVAASMNFPFRYGINTFLLNDLGRRFRDAEFILGIEPRRGGRTHTPWFELDCDDRDRARRGCAGRSGRVTVTVPLGTRSSAIFDVDDDGDLDIVTNDFGSEPMVLVSDLAEKRAPRFLRVTLRGTRSNRDGFGARVTVVAGERRLSKYHDGKSGYLSQSRMPLYFGLGDATSADRIEVAWPSGADQVVEGPLESGRLIEIAEPGE